MIPNTPLFTQSVTTTTGVPTCLLTTTSHIITGLNDGTVSIVSHDLKDERVLEVGVSAVWSLCLVPSPTTNFLAVGSSEGGLSIWSIENGVKMMDLVGHRGTPRCLKVLNDGRLVSAGRDGTLRIWNLDFDKSEGKCEFVLEGHLETIRAFSIYQTSEGKERMMSVSYDTTARIWDPQTGECLKVLKDHSNKIFAMTCSPDGKLAATGGMSGEVKLWDLETSTCSKTMSVLPTDTEPGRGDNILVSRLAFVKIGGKEWLLTGDNLGSLKCWNLDTGSEWKWNVQAHEYAVTSMAVELLRGRVVTGGSDGKIRIWGLEKGICEMELGDGGEAVWQVGVLDGEGKGRVVAAVAREGKVILEVFDIATEK